MQLNKSSETLAAIIVSHRVLGIFVEESRLAMIELMVRRNNGDSFDFESYINQKIIEITPPKTNSINSNSIQIIKRVSNE